MSKRAVNLLRKAMSPAMEIAVKRGLGNQVDVETSADSTAALTAANVLAGIVDCTPTAARSKATDTAANFISGLKLTQDDMSWDFHVINLATTDGYIITLTAGTGVTLAGSPLVYPRDDADNAVSAGSASFRLRRTSSSAVTLYRLA